jgi:hypothetical protein
VVTPRMRKPLGCGKEASENLQCIGAQPGGKLLVGAGFRRPEKVLDIEYRLKNIVH